MRARTTSTHKRIQRGAVGVMMPFLIIIMTAFGALAVDIGYLMVVRNELQNAADAAALAGAAGLSKPTAPNWSNGVSVGQAAIGKNYSGGQQLSDGNVQAGYWDISRGWASTQSSPPALSQSTPPNLTSYVPAVQVTIGRSSGNNGGPVSTWFASIVNGTPASIQATAVAVIAAPGTANPGALFPVAINQCLLTLYWDSKTGKPVNDPSTGQPQVIDIETSYPSKSTTCFSGEWTGFFGSTNASTEKSLVQNGNPTAVSIGDSINISNGVKASVYKVINYPSTVVMPVVSSVTPGSSSPVVGFVGFQITNVYQNGSHSYIEGNFVGGVKLATGGGGTGPYYGAYVPPRLVW
ncbi:pilus assembly protein TadG-related protein [Ralstonia insidiosa]|jgi:Flp pilus assembly protein TadG|uniref:pilus assembly protein TadG-related protein n=1 Tax=Ralstonia TaxID=48736 RepID=UPI0006649DF8|nr:pilus assembly protein TadG-related protein [Ralstonia insidiosa]KMW45265.1 membrane protein [Ralstonia sp. MD27]MBX3774484.1 hypothetical protein [Ralstonia pickettii]NOZ16412.1 hypothetical protein [Betaproteobacteria bacterium]MBA9859026.1 hypothetical protein [Ralstonia insidiosa]MBA9873510.1 hypothetical protein [Ralstonia insidiosa]